MHDLDERLQEILKPREYADVAALLAEWRTTNDTKCCVSFDVLRKDSGEKWGDKWLKEYPRHGSVFDIDINEGQIPSVGDTVFLDANDDAAGGDAILPFKVLHREFWYQKCDSAISDEVRFIESVHVTITPFNYEEENEWKKA